jgi:hypothetical protein
MCWRMNVRHLSKCWPLLLNHPVCDSCTLCKETDIPSIYSEEKSRSEHGLSEIWHRKIIRGKNILKERSQERSPQISLAWRTGVIPRGATCLLSCSMTAVSDYFNCSRCWQSSTYSAQFTFQCRTTHVSKGRGKGKAVPLQAWAGPWGSGRLRLRIFTTFGTMKMVTSSPLRTGRIYHQKYPDTHF